MTEILFARLNDISALLSSNNTWTGINAFSSIVLNGSTSGAITIQPQAAAGTYNFNLPTTAGTSGQLLTSGAGGSSPMLWTANSGHFFGPCLSSCGGNTPAIIGRIGDRLFVGAAADYDGTFPIYYPAASLADYQNAAGWSANWLDRSTFFSQQNATLAVMSRIGQVGAAFGSRTSDNSNGGEGTIPLLFTGINDNSVLGQRAYGAYGECKNYNGAGGCLGIEIDAVQFGTPVTISSYGLHKGGSVVGLWVAQGGGCQGNTSGTVGVPNCFVPPWDGTKGSPTTASAGIAIIANGQPSKAGLIIGYNAIEGTDGNTISAASPAIQMAKGHSIDWLYCANTASYPDNCGDGAIAAQILSTATGNPVRQLFTASTVSFQDQASGETSVNILTNSSYVNWVSLAGGVIGSPISITALGTDTNIGISLIPKGAGTLSTVATQFVFQSAGVTGTLAWAPSTSNKTITLPNGTTDFTATGGTGQFVKQASAGAAFTVAAVAVGELSGLGTGVATALSVNVGTAGSPIVNGGALGSPSSAGTLPAYTLGGTISGGGNQINNVIVGTTTPLAGHFTTLDATTGVTAGTAGSPTSTWGIVAYSNVQTYPSTGFGLVFGTNFSSGSGEIVLMNTNTSATATFDVFQQTGASAATRVFRVSPLGSIELTKRTASASAPGAGFGKLELVCGTNAGTAKIIAYAGTSGTAVTVLDNIGAGVTGC